LGRQALALKVDVSKWEDVNNMVNLTLQKFGKIDVLVNSAGILGPVGTMADNDVNQWIETININLIGTFLCCRAVLPIMIKQQKGKVINFSGGGAVYPRPNFSAYATSKAAVVRLTETLAEETKKCNIQVNAIAPGAVETRLHEQILAAGEMAGEKARAESRKVKEEGGTPLELPAGLAVFLASDESNGLTGRLISAVWDNWQEMGKRIPEIMSTNWYTSGSRVTPPKGH
jgi:NAD(P)-dependent dehydrogenase (short-subunit alcohol dehydrogenase family)